MKTLTLIFLLITAPSALALDRFQVRTDQPDVNLWWHAGRANSYTFARVARGERLTVLRETQLPNGQTWYRVRAEASPGLREEPEWGWVDAKFFERLSSRRTDRAEADFCPSCSARERARRAGQLGRLPMSPRAEVSRSGFIWPVHGVIRSRFGYRVHPITGRTKLHGGIDIAGNRGKTVAAAKSGRVVRASHQCVEGDLGCNRGAGNIVVIDHGDGTSSEYMHLSRGCRLPAVGARVVQGAPIGCVGSTGMSTGAHLHFGVRINNKLVDPMSVLPRR